MSIDKISALLAKAESTDNEAEADAYMKKAQMLATTYSIDLAVARSHVAKQQKREVPESRRVKVADERGRDINKHLIELMSVICHSNDLRLTISWGNTSITMFGFPSDMEVAEALFMSLSHQMVEAGGRYIKSGEWKGETYWGTIVERDHWGDVYDRYEGRKTYTARSARNAFYDGWISRIEQRLREARRAAIEEYKAAPENAPMENGQPTSGSGTDLVLKAKKKEVEEFYAKTSNARGSWKGSNAARGGAASGAGRSAANSARLGSQRGIAGKRGAIA